MSRVHIAASSPSTDPLPKLDDDIIEWAHSKFVQWATTPHPTAYQPLAKPCLLLSIEEAAAVAAAQHNPPTQSDTKRTDGTKSTWNSERLDLLADTARSLFYQECPSPPPPPPDSSSSSSQDQHRQLIQTYPMQLILAINKTLKQQGYRRMKKHGDIKSSLISYLLETGTGSPAALAVLYIEIAARLGMPLGPCLLEEGRYVLLKATGDVLLRSPLLHTNQDDKGGEFEDFLIDPYAGGAIYSVSECRDLFRKEDIQTSSNRQLLAALLLALQEAYWAGAVGCPPEPAFMIPISLDVALNTYDDVDISISMTDDDGNDSSRITSLWRPKRGFHLQRALAACTKRCALLPNDRDVKLERTLLLYFSRQFLEAKDELNELININDDKKSKDKMQSLLQRLNLELSLLTAAPM